MYLYKYYISILILFFALSCKTPKDVVYFQESTNDELVESTNDFSLKYKHGDELVISVTALNLATVAPFNRGFVSEGTSDQSNSQNSNSGSSYVINSSGLIEFPVLGELKVIGLNQLQVQQLIKEKLKPYVKDANVSVTLQNFKITILGEVNSPGVYQISNERVTIVEAIGLAKDLNIRGKRENITVVRENKNGKVYHKLDLTSKEIFNSPIYYLKQNDIVYVEPNKTQIKSSKNYNLPRILTSISSVLGIILSTLALTTR